MEYSILKVYTESKMNNIFIYIAFNFGKKYCPGLTPASNQTPQLTTLTPSPVGWGRELEE